MNENYIVLEGDIENLTEDCTFAKIRKGGISLKQYDSTSKKTVTIFLTNEEVGELASELSTKMRR